MSLQNVFALFEQAINNKLKYPCIRLQDSNGGPVALKRAGSMSKYEGQIMITDGTPFGSNKYFGRVDQTGVFHTGRDSNPSIQLLLADLATDPVAVAQRFAKLTGRCIFCDKFLQDARSTANGYGPVCAKKYNLPWDAAKESKAVEGGAL